MPAPLEDVVVALVSDGDVLQVRPDGGRWHVRTSSSSTWASAATLRSALMQLVRERRAGLQKLQDQTEASAASIRVRKDALAALEE